MAGAASKSVKILNFPFGKQIKSNYALLPIVFSLGVGIALSVFHSFRLLTKGPDVQFNRRGNPAPYDKLVNPDGTAVQYKYYSTLDYSKIRVDEDKPKL